MTSTRRPGKLERGRPVRPGLRILGIDDAPFPRHRGPGREVLVVGCLFRVGLGVEGVVSTRIRKDGRNSTDKLLELIARSRFRSQIQVLMIDGIALGGFNVIDLERLAMETGIVVMTIMRRPPDLAAIRSALGHLESDGRRWRLIEKAGPVHAAGPVHFQIKNATVKQGEDIVKLSTLIGHVPEPLRLAHIIGAGVVQGESRGRA